MTHSLLLSDTSLYIPYLIGADWTNNSGPL